MNHRRWARLGAAVTAVSAVLLAVSGCTGSSLGDDAADSAGQELPIGLIVPKTGVYKAVGDDLIAGFRLYLNTHNGKLGGRNVRLVEADEGNGGEAARASGKKLLEQDRVVAIAGGATAPTTATLHPMLADAQVPLVGTGGRPSTIEDPDYLWHTSWMSEETGAAIADHLRTTINGPVFAIGPDYVGGHDQLGGFTRAYTAGGGKLANAGGTPEWTPWDPKPETNFEPYLTKIRATGAKAVYTFYAGSSATEFVKQYKKFGVGLPLYGAGFLTEGSALLASQGDAALGIYTCLNYSSTLDNPANREFVRQFQSANKGASPTIYHVTAWDAALVLDKAITEALAYPSPSVTADLSSAPASGAPPGTGPSTVPGGTASGGGNTAAGVSSAAVNRAMSRIGGIDSPRGPWQFGTRNHTPVQRWYLRQVTGDGKDGKGVVSNLVLQELATLGS